MKEDMPKYCKMAFLNWTILCGVRSWSCSLQTVKEQQRD